MTFEIDTRIFEGMPWLWEWSVGVGIVLVIISFAFTMILLFDGESHKRYALIPFTVAVLGMVLAVFGGSSLMDEQRIRDVAFYSELEEKHGLTRVDLNNMDKTFTAEDKDGQYIDCGMIPLNQTLFKVVCE